MYDGLTPLFNRVQQSDLTRYFKSEALGRAPGATREERIPGRPGISIQRDEFNVPHIRGATDDDVTFAVAWVSAEDRGLLFEQARYNARAAAVDAPGLSALELTAQLLNFQPSAQTEAEVAKQARVLESKGEKGRQVLHDIDVYLQGANAFLRFAHRNTKPVTRNDIFALNALKGQFVGQGGGRETQASMFLNGLQKDLGSRKGLSVFNDLRQRRNADTAVSVDGRFPYAPIPRHRRGNVTVDNGSFLSSTVEGAPVAPAPRASNVIMVGPKRSASGRALMTGGPQIGYFYPGFVLEVDIAGPGYEARGVTTAPFPGYVFIGRREDFAFTLTSAGADIIDHYVETLCGSDTKYEYRGKCLDMERFDAGKLKGTDGVTREVVFNKTVHGPVIGYATVNGRRVAISRKRSSYGRDTEDQLLYHDVTKGNIRGPRDLFRAASQSPQTFNTFYVDRRNIGMYTSGSLPLRPRSIDSGLPVDGRGNYEWHGRLAASKHPQGVNPRSGLLVNWNNKPAADFPGADDQFGYGSIQRNDLLTGRLKTRRKHDLASIVAAHNAAATMDVRQRVLPVLARVLRTGPAPSARAKRMLELLEQWRDNGSSRLDGDLDGKIDAAGAAVMDTAWPKLADATIKPLVRGPLANQLSSTLFRRFDLPPAGQFSGWHQYMDRDLRKLLGLQVKDPLRNRYCGRGNLKRCRDSLWSALERAGDELAAKQGPNPDAWRSGAERERIVFRPGLLSTTMRYTNRPSGIDQVIEFAGHR
jgi:acyl-homoserine lactone acylase PvdQ